MGFNIKFVVGPVSRDLICPLCRGVLVDPMMMHPCQHTVCSSCLKALRPVPKLLKSCPFCRSPLFDEPSLAPGNLIGRLLKLIVKCHRECGHRCELSALPDHVLNECKFGTVDCLNKVRGCHKEMTRKKLDAHVAECDFRLVTCEGCNAEMVYSRLPMHQKRRRCVEGKLMTQRARSAATALKQVREHQEQVRKEAITLEGQLTRLRSSKLEARSRLRSAPPRISLLSEAPSSKSRPNSSRSSISTISLSSSSTSNKSPRSRSPKVNVFITDTTSFDVIPLDLKNTTSTTSSSSSLSSLRQASSEHEHDLNEPMDAASESIGDHREPISSLSVVRHQSNRSEKTELCKRCEKSFNPAKNNDRACRWHRGQIVNLFVSIMVYFTL
ncbi:E3 ubiquitin-protein ligase PDZRN3 [Strongylocentrotus purpuratus]|uniref:RING-type domain-containing protein n=1 Tax=Strongylocentrotus purpuratus TaxID=7668 RepID=A0A7M7SYE6_STRPU|nr:E3 ubiquitin-protein ligase PDZRN3 [Strongylocentrotus purpuratus]XP_030840423.1 E3 ubiquitin-protein ligase PDZRN3 [Strongylocentrotus purpuratus]